MLLRRSSFGFLLATCLALPLASGCGEEDPEGSSSGEDESSSGTSTTTDTDASTTTTDNPTTDTTTDASDTSMDTTTTDTTDTSTFVNNDMSAGCGTECDIWNPTECAEGEKCTAVACEIGSNSWDSNVCRPIEGDKTEGDECEGAGTDGYDDCAAGLMCWDANPDTGFGNCIAFCSGSVDAPTCEDNNKLCAVANDGTLPICLDKCDPLAVDCPQGDDLCIPNPGEPGFVCVLDASGGMSPYATPCNGPNEDDNSCNLGLICIPADAVPETTCQSAIGCCSPICDVTAPNDCPGQGQTCENFYESPVPGYEDVGICTIAQ